MLKFTKKLDYTLSILTYMGKDQKPSSASAISSTLKLPSAVTASILKTLVNLQLLKSQRGPSGGYYLARDPQLISIFELVEGIDGPFFLTSCMQDSELCAAFSSCNSKWSLFYIQNEILKLLRSISIADMIKAGNSNFYNPSLYNNLLSTKNGN